MKQLFFLLIGLILSSTTLSAQDYKTSLGLRISPYYGVTFKHFIKSDRALEAILSTRKGGVSFTGLYEVHTPAFSANRLQAFGGIGGHINIFRDRYNDFWDWDNDKYDNRIRLDDEHRLSIGIDMILGLEYTFTDLPFNLSVDWKPALNLIGDYGISANQFALSFRFIF